MVMGALNDVIGVDLYITKMVDEFIDRLAAFSKGRAFR
jgi:hypothetical protein